MLFTKVGYRLVIGAQEKQTCQRSSVGSPPSSERYARRERRFFVPTFVLQRLAGRSLAVVQAVCSTMAELRRAAFETKAGPGFIRTPIPNPGRGAS